MRHSFKYIFRNFNKPLGIIFGLSIASCILGYIGIYLFEDKVTVDNEREYYLYVDLIQEKAIENNSLYDEAGWELVYSKENEVTDIRGVETFAECFNYLKGVEKKYFVLGFKVYCYSEQHDILYDIYSDWLDTLQVD